MTSNLILVDQAFCRHAINDWLCCSESFNSGTVIASLNGSENFFNIGTQHRTTAGVVLTTLFRLKRALLCSLAISQGATPNYGVNTFEGGNMPAFFQFVNDTYSTMSNVINYFYAVLAFLSPTHVKCGAILPVNLAV